VTFYVLSFKVFDHSRQAKAFLRMFVAKIMDYPVDLGFDKELATRLESFFKADRVEALALYTKFIERSTSFE
jgi:hypothetical protein